MIQRTKGWTDAHRAAFDARCDEAGLAAAARVVGDWGATFEHRLLPIYSGLRVLDDDIRFVSHIRANRAALEARLAECPAAREPSRPDGPRGGRPAPKLAPLP